jgi:formiminotetrahydrofolate cyclodeaminase
VTHKQRIRGYLKELASESAAPGGGSAASLVFCVGISLIQMAINFSLSNNKKELKSRLLQLERIKTKSINYIDLDGKLFLSALKAKGKNKKRAYQDLAKITFALADNCIKILMIGKLSRRWIKKNIIVDFDLGIDCVKVALKGASRNLEVNSRIFTTATATKKFNYLKGAIKRIK